MKSKMVVLVLAAAFLFGTTAYAHHSFASTYDLSRQVKVEGKLVQFLFRNPHSFVHVQAVDESGVQQRWAVEWSGVSQLGNQGLSRESLKVGDEVVIFGRPSRVAGEYRALMVSLKRPSDGFTWGVKSGEAVD